MELLSGHPLGERIKEGPLPEKTIGKYVLYAKEALDREKQSQSFISVRKAHHQNGLSEFVCQISISFWGSALFVV